MLEIVFALNESIADTRETINKLINTTGINDTFRIGSNSVTFPCNANSALFGASLLNNRLEGAKLLADEELVVECTEVLEDFKKSYDHYKSIDTYRVMLQKDLDLLREAKSLLTLDEKRELFKEESPYQAVEIDESQLH